MELTLTPGARLSGHALLPDGRVLEIRCRVLETPDRTVRVKVESCDGPGALFVFLGPRLASPARA